MIESLNYEFWIINSELKIVIFKINQIKYERCKMKNYLILVLVVLTMEERMFMIERISF